MIMPPRKLILAGAISLAIATASAGVLAATESQDITNARQESQILTTYALSSYLRAHDLKVSVTNGKATLTGNVAEDVNKELAEEIALGVKGVSEVDNRIVVDADYMPPKSAAERSFADIINDASMTSVIKSKLLWSKNADGMSTKVNTKSGRVTLSGTVMSAADKELAGRLALNTHGVISVDNQLKVNEQKPGIVASGKQAADAVGSEISDSWITAKVKSTLLYSSNIAGSAIEVSTDHGVVTLSGKVNNGAEQALAVELAQNVRGVKSVQSKQLTF